MMSEGWGNGTASPMPPGIAAGDDGAVSAIDGVVLALREGVHSLSLSDGRVGDIAASSSPPAWLALPGFVDLHLHANRAFSAGAARPRSLAEAIAQSTEARRSASEADCRDRAMQVFGRVLGHGTIHARTHTDVDDLAGLRAIAGVAAARDAFAGRMDIDIIAFATSRLDPADADARTRLADAVAAGADLLGAAPAFYGDPVRSIDALLDLAQSLRVPVDVHLDEHTDASRCLSGHLAEATIARGLHGRVTLSHGCALSVLPRDEAARVIARIAEARLTVVALPATNLYLQGRGGDRPGVRGVAPLHALVAAGVAVRFGSDNMRDAFYPYGDGDPLEAAFLAAIAGQLDDEAHLVAGICSGEPAPVSGQAADLVLIPALSLAEALARRPPGRVVLRQGRVVSTKRP